MSSHSFFLKLFNKPSILSTSFVRFLFPILFLVTLNTFPQEGDIEAGKQLFNTNCASCHKLDRKMTGPALRYVEKRLAEDEGLDREWLYKWIRNSSSLIKSGDAYAVKIYEEYNRAAMTLSLIHI